ncbi:hypothetical protein HPP92_014972 [Vanilla planifolia]|uniref:tRNA-dihydrouridine(47) synthase [NAD(P)(+)] n=1 Tax=Vanilla planifolia TaxID=51239 RepID=A0A835QMM2_VANPL|nr:hypothetical protein HPP92_014972 [Vanilla planifolia]
MLDSKFEVLFKNVQEKKSAVHICPAVAKNGKADACRFGVACRYNHDIDAFVAQKPADLEGICPFIAFEDPCPYGITCRFFNTHGRRTSVNLDIPKISYEINTLSKDVQKLLWKNKIAFSRADVQLKRLGLKRYNPQGLNVAEAKNSDGCNGLLVDEVCDPYCISNHDLQNCHKDTIAKDCSNNVSDESRPLKKSKYVGQESVEVHCSEGSDGRCERKNNISHINLQNEPEGASRIITCSSKVDLDVKPHAREKKLIDFRGKLYLAPLTTVGNLPFRRICKALGADITCGEMAVCTNLLQGQASEWALLRKHSSEDIFGVQICGAYPDTVARTVEIIDQQCSVDFIDINMGCPIDVIVNKGAGSSLLTKPMRMKSIIQAASETTIRPLTIKVRTGFFEGRNRVDSLISDFFPWGANAVTIHGRSRQQRYSKLADWNYIYQCASKASTGLHVLGNGDIFSYCDYNKHMSDCPKLSSCMIARGALIKPWIFSEIKEQRHWDISSGERLNILKDFVNFGLEHWGSDTKGVETTRHFLLEWLGYTHRYIPVGLLEVIPQHLNWRPPSYFGRDDLETLMASDSAADWIRISEMLLGECDYLSQLYGSKRVLRDAVSLRINVICRCLFYSW